MALKIKDLLKSRDAKIILVDLLMMAVLIANLVLILFDLLFTSAWVQALISKYLPQFYQFYLTEVHQDFFAIDIWFVGIFLLELSIRWIIAIRQKTYFRWFFYPFIHWYDVLGCIPVGSFRFLRVLRIVSIVVRLQKLKIIDITKTYLFGAFNKYLNILTEEVSDRVVVNVLSGVQDEVQSGNPLFTQILDQVIEPQRPILVEWLSHRLQHVVTESYSSYQADLQNYVADIIKNAVDGNREISNIAKIPVVGPTIATNLEDAISDIVYQVMDQAIQDLGSPQNKAIINDMAHLSVEAFTMKEEDRQLDRIVRNIVVESLELVKDQVKVQQWKIREEEIREARLKKKLGDL